jgi:ubiquinone/menaquinone biosynthesis C-methylase UbiE
MSRFEVDDWTAEGRDDVRRDERRSRDAGASDYLAKAMASRGPLRWERENVAVLRALSPRPEDRVLDAGCGVGRHALAVAPHVRRVACVDFSSGALQVLLAEARRRGLTNVTAAAGDLSSLPLRAGQFDAAICCEVLQHIPGQEARVGVLADLRRTLAPGGRLVLTTLAFNARTRGPQEGRWPNGAYFVRTAPDEMRGQLRAAGFAAADVRGLLVLPGFAQRWLRFGWSRLEALATALPISSRAGAFLLTVARA